MAPTCSKNGARRCLLLSCFVVIGFLVTPSLAGLRPFEYDLIEEQSSFEFERADSNDDGLEVPPSSDNEAPSPGSETGFEAKFNELLKERNLTEKISPETISRKFDSKAKSEARGRGIFHQIDEKRVKDRLAQLAKIKLQPQYSDLFGQKPVSDGPPPKKDDFSYDDGLARSRMFPMAAASYGTRENVQHCLKQTYGNDATLINYTNVACQNRAGETCGGFVALSKSEEAIIISFRGTNSFGQLLVEIDSSLSDSIFDQLIGKLLHTIEMPNNGGGVLAYFYDIFTQIWIQQRMVLDVARLIKDKPDYKIYVTGHSLGGALAAIAARHIQMDIIPDHAERIHLLTLGQPRTGDKKWANLAENALSNFNYRVTHGVDIVPQVPPHKLLPLSPIQAQHMKTEVWYDNHMNSGDAFKICPESGESSKCSISKWPLIRNPIPMLTNTKNDIEKFKAVLDHLVYFDTCVPLFGRDGCVIRTGLPGRYTECNDPEFTAEFLKH